MGGSFSVPERGWCMVTEVFCSASPSRVLYPEDEARTRVETSGVTATTAMTALEAEVATLIVGALQLEVQPQEIDPEAPLFGEGLGLDSIDALEMALAISRNYGFQLRSDDERNGRIFASLRALTAHIEKNRVG
jgi:acyl carrier protein